MHTTKKRNKKIKHDKLVYGTIRLILNPLQLQLLASKRKYLVVISINDSARYSCIFFCTVGNSCKRNVTGSQVTSVFWRWRKVSLPRVCLLVIIANLNCNRKQLNDLWRCNAIFFYYAYWHLTMKSLVSQSIIICRTTWRRRDE